MQSAIHISKENSVKLLISAFLLFHIYAVSLWLLPNSRWRDTLLRPIEPYLTSTGLWQTFAVFSPDPRRINLHLTALVTFQDGATTVWEFPRMEHLNLLDKAIKERFRKFGHDYLNWDDNRMLWPDMCRWIARNYSAQGLQPVRVSLVRHWSDIPDPNSGLPLPGNWNQHTFFVYNVMGEDLQ